MGPSPWVRLHAPQLLAVLTFALGAKGQDDASTRPPAEATRIAWKYAPAGSRFEGALARDGTVFALDRSGSIHAIDAATGDARWKTTVLLPLDYGYGLDFGAQPGFDAIVVGSDSGFFAFDRATGKMLWHTAIAKGVAGPTCTATLAIAGGADGKVYACDLKSGHIVWQHDYLEDRPDDPPGFAGDAARFKGRPARPGTASTDGTMVTLSIFDQCRALALDAATGKRLWDFRTKGWMYGEPTFGALNVFVGSQDGCLYALDRETGKPAWKLATDARVEARATPADRFVYFGSCDGNVYAVDQTVDHVVWKFPTEMAEGGGAPMYDQLLVTSDTVYVVALRGKVYALERGTGALRWKVEPLAKSELVGKAAQDGKLIFVTTRGSSDGGESAVIAVRAQ